MMFVLVKLQNQVWFKNSVWNILFHERSLSSTSNLSTVTFLKEMQFSCC